MQQVKKMGSLGSIMGMMPGMSGVEVGDEEEKKMKRTEAIIQSMTIQERRMPRLLRGSRLKRIANGSGVQVRDVNALLKQFNQMQKMMKRMRGGKGRKMMKAMQSQMGTGGAGGPDSGGLPKNLPGL
jgi:signal recognition particle subunit SRP54